MTPEENRNLTDADVSAIVGAMKEQIIKEFYEDLGKGVWSLLWKLIVSGGVVVAAYGAGKGIITK